LDSILNLSLEPVGKDLGLGDLESRLLRACKLLLDLFQESRSALGLALVFDTLYS